MEAAFWWAVCVGIWLLTLSSISTAEVVTAVVASVPCAVLAVAARRGVEGSWLLRPRWARWLLPLPVAVLGDAVRVLGLAAGVLVGRRIPDGEVRSVDLPRDRPARLQAGRQAAAVLAVGAAPGTVVLDIDEDTGRMLVHALGAGRPRMEEAVRG
jgi:multisubunit Na+/H+ antiporter MnhE subunit